MESSAFASSDCGKTHFFSSSDTGMIRSRTAVCGAPLSGSTSVTLLQKARDCSPFMGLV